MAKMQREKGARGERELFAQLTDQLGTVVQRNLGQTRYSGSLSHYWKLVMPHHPNAAEQAIARKWMAAGSILYRP
jgi:hypothetical protein